MVNNRNARCAANSCGNNCRTLAGRLYAVDFALNETVLYLDAYPESAEAMKFYRELVKERERLMDSYEGQCGPVTMYGNRSGSWDWIRGPWPWEADAN